MEPLILRQSNGTYIPPLGRRYKYSVKPVVPMLTMSECPEPGTSPEFNLNPLSHTEAVMPAPASEQCPVSITGAQLAAIDVVKTSQGLLPAGTRLADEMCYGDIAYSKHRLKYDGIATCFLVFWRDCSSLAPSYDSRQKTSVPNDSYLREIASALAPY